MSSQTKIIRNCLYCGAVISGRLDKKFCDDNCRNNYHYKVKDRNADVLMIKMINETLLCNRDILKSLCVGQKTIVKKRQLDDKRFDYDLITCIYKTKVGTEYRVIYDYAYKLLNDDEVQLLKFVI